MRRIFSYAFALIAIRLDTYNPVEPRRGDLSDVLHDTPPAVMRDHSRHTSIPVPWVLMGHIPVLMQLRVFITGISPGPSVTVTKHLDCKWYRAFGPSLLPSKKQPPLLLIVGDRDAQTGGCLPYLKSESVL
jgi:hypothetical protein